MDSESYRLGEDTPDQRKRAAASVARWNVLFPLEDIPAWKRVVSEARERQVAYSAQLNELDLTMGEKEDPQKLAMRIMFLHARWVGEIGVIRLLQAAKRDNEEACAYLDSLKAQKKER